MTTEILTTPDFPELPSPVYLRHDEFGADSHSAAHQHAWGQLNFVSHGLMELEVAGQRFLSPPQYAVWIPPHMEHSAYNRQAVIYRSLYLSLEHCTSLPAEPCTLVISEILKAILNDFAERDVKVPEQESDIRLAQVLVDQMRLARVQTRYLPYAQSQGLLSVLQGLQADPGDNRPLVEWAKQVHVSERTLARQCVRELGMSFGEWRQRLRFMASIEALEGKLSVQEVAFDMGYSSSSAFISMFQRLAGCTPEQYRRQARKG
ncbi:AraC family transcriptional regulator [Pseudomonas sp. NA-150]|uniref:AraC family transcriptional regulator n=1 Tax=Pseudomonas sp. NA-150 TaxID=3367525 RepID=UPI0037C590ED